MNWIDYAIVIVIAGGAINGFSQGIVRQLIAVMGFSAGFVLAGQYSEGLAERLTFIGDSNWANIVAFAIIIVVASAIGNLLGQMLHRFVGLMMFGCYDRILGAAFGAFFNILIIEIGLIVLSSFPVFGVESFDSTFVRKLLEFAPGLLNLMPQEFDIVRQFIAQSTR